MSGTELLGIEKLQEYKNTLIFPTFSVCLKHAVLYHKLRLFHWTHTLKINLTVQFCLWRNILSFLKVLYFLSGVLYDLALISIILAKLITKKQYTFYRLWIKQIISLFLYSLQHYICLLTIKRVN